MTPTHGLIHPVPAGFVGSKKHYLQGVEDRLNAELKQLRGLAQVTRPKQCPLHDMSHRQGWLSVSTLDIDVLKARELRLTAAQCCRAIRHTLHRQTKPTGGIACPHS
ncbi:hypothetical protein [Agarivorans sp. QJM3NY_25]|uniref:hypothetical protein n=1 Tax=Agarivorans sp. QJM3NY_25 TaxID=3421430 RepID=UPI003D7E7EA0